MEAKSSRDVPTGTAPMETVTLFFPDDVPASTNCRGGRSLTSDCSEQTARRTVDRDTTISKSQDHLTAPRKSWPTRGLFQPVNGAGLAVLIMASQVRATRPDRMSGD